MNPTDAQGDAVRPLFHDALTDLVCALVEFVDTATAYVSMLVVEDAVEVEAD